MADRTFYKLEIRGIVYLVDPATAVAHTYDLVDPTPIGKVTWTDASQPPSIALYPNWQEIMTAKLAATTATQPNTSNDAPATSL